MLFPRGREMYCRQVLLHFRSPEILGICILFNPGRKFRVSKTSNRPAETNRRTIGSFFPKFFTFCLTLLLKVWKFNMDHFWKKSLSSNISELSERWAIPSSSLQLLLWARKSLYQSTLLLLLESFTKFPVFHSSMSQDLTVYAQWPFFLRNERSGEQFLPKFLIFFMLIFSWCSPFYTVPSHLVSSG